jgi:hypothetical protein
MPLDDLIAMYTRLLDFHDERFTDGRFPMIYIKRTELRELLDYVGRLRQQVPTND